jgi:exopolysaccharide biosynthesis protein
MVIHVVTVDLKNKSVKPFVTPPDNPGAAKPVNARTTATFLEEYNLQLAINGDAFLVTRFADLLRLYPNEGTPVNPWGLAASSGETYTQDTDEEHTLYFFPSNKASIDNRVGRVWMAVSGSKLILNNNVAIGHSDDTGPEPRTAVGINQAGNKLVIIVVDGRQNGYSEGATLLEMAVLMQDLRMYDAINLDGGGSSSLVIEGPDGEPVVLNSPIHGGVPGTLRPVANHLGFYADP